MCQPKPGPRCAGHIKEEMERTQERILHLEAKQQLLQTPGEQKEKIDGELRKLRNKVALLDRDYRITPEGRRRTKELYDFALESGSDNGMDRWQATLVSDAARYNHKMRMLHAKKDAEADEEQRARGGLPENVEISASINAFESIQDPDYNPIDRVEYGHGEATVYVHPDSNVNDVAHKFAMAGGDLSRVSFKTTRVKIPNHTLMPTLTAEELEKAHGQGRLGAYEHYVSEVNKGTAAGGVRMVYMHGIGEHYVATDSQGVKVLVMPMSESGGTRGLAPEEPLIAARMANLADTVEVTHRWERDIHHYEDFSVSSFNVSTRAGQVTRARKKDREYAKQQYL